MEIYHINDDLHLLGFQVKTFPVGVMEAFDALNETLPDGHSRTYYGLSWMEDRQIIYKVATEEHDQGEADKYQYERYTVPKGQYLMEKIMDWPQKIDSFKGVFETLLNDPRRASDSICIELYKNDEEVLCLVKVKVPE